MISTTLIYKKNSHPILIKKILKKPLFIKIIFNPIKIQAHSIKVKWPNKINSIRPKFKIP